MTSSLSFERICWRRGRWLLAFLALATSDLAIHHAAKRRMMVWGIEPVVGDVEDPDIYRAPTRTPEFMGSQSPATASALRRQSASALPGARSTVDSVRALRRWVHSRVARFGDDVEQRGHSLEPLAILNDLQRGYAANCGPLAVLLTESLRAHGVAARQVLIFESPPFRRGFGHAVVEAWVGDQWIVQDPTVGTEWQVRGQPASARATAVAWRSDVPAALFADGGWDARLPSVRRQYESSLAHVLIVRERSPAAAALARLPLAKLLLPSLVDVSSARSAGLSPFVILTALAWVVYLIIPAAGLVCLWMVIRPARPHRTVVAANIPTRAGAVAGAQP